jgi:hypothetical protein
MKRFKNTDKVALKQINDFLRFYPKALCLSPFIKKQKELPPGRGKEAPR